MPNSHASTRSSTWSSFGVCLAVLLLFAWVARQAVDRNGGYFSNNEFQDWLVVVGIVGGCCLVFGVVLVRRPVGRGMLIGTVLAVLLVGAALLAEVLLNAS